jgi:hypothetical protein
MRGPLPLKAAPPEVLLQNLLLSSGEAQEVPEVQGHLHPKTELQNLLHPVVLSKQTQMNNYVGIDNGVSGSIGVLPHNGTPYWVPMPVRSELNYTKAKKNITRIDVVKLEKELERFANLQVLVGLERPMVNPGRFQATASALRALEATLIVLERLGLPYRYLDSKEWQKTQLPSGLKGEELKKASLDVGRRYWPYIKFKPDADSMLLARHLKQINA